MTLQLPIRIRLSLWFFAAFSIAFLPGFCLCERRPDIREN